MLLIQFKIPSMLNSEFVIDSVYSVINAKLWICWSVYNAMYAEPEKWILLNMNAKLWKKGMFLIPKAVKQVQSESEYYNTVVIP
jgi:hypothetical protein